MFKEQSPRLRSLLAQTKGLVTPCPRTCPRTGWQTRPEVWVNKDQDWGGCSYSDMAKVKVPLRWMSLPSFRPFDPVLTLQLPFEGIEVRSLFVYMSAMTPCQPPPDWPSLGSANPACCQGSHWPMVVLVYFRFW